MGKRALASVAQVSVPPKRSRVIAFYSDKEGKKWREFSNFYRHPAPFEFVLPAFARLEGLPGSVQCDFSEKAIMVTKAALMGDAKSFKAITDAPDPKACKALGRGVQGFDQKLWERHLEEVAFEVMRQKFASSANLREVLLSTGDAILAEAAPYDAIWGIGLSGNDERVKDPSTWQGRNILGYALMRARDHLRGSTSTPSGAAAVGSGTGAVDVALAPRATALAPGSEDTPASRAPGQ